MSLSHSLTNWYRCRGLAGVVVSAIISCHGAGCQGSGDASVTLRGDVSDSRCLALTGPGARQFVTSGPRGWTISVPDCAASEPIGMLLKAVVHGDFQLEADYEIETLSPAGGAGAGPSIYIATDQGAKNAAQFARLDRVAEGSVVSSGFLYTDKKKRRRFDLKFTPSQARSGRLRLQRQGSTLVYSSRQPDQDWTELRRIEFGQHPVSTIRFALERGTVPKPATIHWKEISLAMDEQPVSWKPAWQRRLLFFAGALSLPAVLVAAWLALDARQSRTVVQSFQPAPVRVEG